VNNYAEMSTEVLQEKADKLFEQMRALRTWGNRGMSLTSRTNVIASLREDLTRVEDELTKRGSI